MDHTLLREAKSGAAGLPTDPVIHRMAQELSFAPDPLLTAAAEADDARVRAMVREEIKELLEQHEGRFELRVTKLGELLA